MINGTGTEPGGSLERLRETNRLRVVEALRLRGSASRAELVELTGLSRTTITSLLSDLQARGLIAAGSDRSLRGRGRPPVLLRLAPSAGAALGVSLGPTPRDLGVGAHAWTRLPERPPV
jgi:DNA-binding transcriptional ArsR family regulator